jgi:RimJ/RimL family protein N-acetyltransferase
MNITLHPWTVNDRESLIALCNAVDRTFLSDRLPYPYTEADADWWLGMVAENDGKEGVWRSIWADDQLIGSISVEREANHGHYTGVIGYMILTPWWSKGIGTEAVRQMCGIAYRELAIDRIIGEVFPDNLASARVLEKNGFRLDETKQVTIVKEGKVTEVRVFVHTGLIL